MDKLFYVRSEVQAIYNVMMREKEVNLEKAEKYKETEWLRGFYRGMASMQTILIQQMEPMLKELGCETTS